MTKLEAELNALIENQTPVLVHAHRAELFDALAEALSNDLADRVVKPIVFAWRNGEIKSLREIRTHLRQPLRDWLSGEEARKQINAQYLKWFAGIQKEVEAQTRGIWEKHGLAPELPLSPALESTLDAELGRLGEADSILTPSLAWLEEIGPLVSAVLGVGGFLFAAGMRGANTGGSGNRVSVETIESVVDMQKPALRGWLRRIFDKNPTLEKKLVVATEHGLKILVREKLDLIGRGQGGENIL